MLGHYYRIFFHHQQVQFCRISTSLLQIRLMTTSNENYDFDYFVIGGGSGGVRSSRIAAQHGARVALAEEKKLG
jgi:ribulose 1,5-bisphosphate synthetase/thiazole synthase